jgi:hypothetical protein
MRSLVTLRIHWILLALLLAGCSPQRLGAALGEALVAPFVAEATAPPEAPAFRPLAPTPPDRAVLYIYRPPLQFSGGGYPQVSVGGQEKFPLKQAGYRALTLDPGELEIKAECVTNWFPPTATRTLSVEAGREYYVRVIPSWAPNATAEQALDPQAKPQGLSPFGTCRTGQTLITLVPKEQALAEIGQTRLLTEEPLPQAPSSSRM